MRGAFPLRFIRRLSAGKRKSRGFWGLCAAGLLASCDFHVIDLLPQASPVSGNGTGGAPDEPPPDPEGGAGGEPPAAGGAMTSLGGAAGMGGTTVSPPDPVPVRVLLVVDDVPISTDDAIESRLLALEAGVPFEVDRIAEAMTTPASTEGYDVVIVSSSADSNNTGIGGSLKDIPVPLLSLEPNIFNLMGLGPQRVSSMDDEMTIVEESHPIAHGQTGALTICGAQTDIVGQALQPGGSLVSRAVVNTNAGVIVAYEKGVDVGGALPERRVSFGALKLASCQTETSWTFFDAIVLWLARI